MKLFHFSIGMWRITHSIPDDMLGTIENLEKLSLRLESEYNDFIISKEGM